MTKSKIGKIIAYVLILLAVCTAIGLIAHFTNGFTSDFKTFYVTVDGKDIMSSSGDYYISESKPLAIDVKYTFGFATQEKHDYTVKIIPNVKDENNFSFTVGEETHSFKDEKDLTSAFNIVKEEKSFKITPKADNLTDFFKILYPEQEISDCEDYGYANMFTAVVTSYNGEASVKIYFAIEGTEAGVKLDKEVIIF